MASNRSHGTKGEMTVDGWVDGTALASFLLFLSSAPSFCMVCMQLHAPSWPACLPLSKFQCCATHGSRLQHSTAQSSSASRSAGCRGADHSLHAGLVVFVTRWTDGREAGPAHGERRGEWEREMVEGRIFLRDHVVFSCCPRPRLIPCRCRSKPQSNMLPPLHCALCVRICTSTDWSTVTCIYHIDLEISYTTQVLKSMCSSNNYPKVRSCTWPFFEAKRSNVRTPTLSNSKA